jgi:N-methylhydantoinase A/oxoprolinase/acetone carboxylase beta subunit
MTTGPYAVGLDIGGTFTDLVLLDADGGTAVHKLLTTPDNPEQAALAGVAELVAANGVDIADVDLLVHSTTLVTNALTQQRGARTGLITTKGFRDILEMRTEHRYDIYDLFLEWPPPLVPRERRLTVGERTMSDGTILAEPQEDEVADALAQLEADGVEAIAICFLHSYANAANERLVADIIRRLAPQMPITLSSETAPVIREYERTSTAVADAYVRPLTDAYLTRMAEGLANLGFAGNLYLMLSAGGSASVETARRHPIRLLESGPAAGALAAGLYGELTNSDPVVSFDMGGTTAKLCLLDKGRPTVVNTLEVARTRRFMRGSGIPILAPSVELIEIGAGGGSIARLDPLGLLKVGPDSASAEPGPVCYNRGGTEPTVTDANLLLGYLDPAYFLGGRLTLSLEATRAAFEALGAQSGMSAVAAAWGVHSVVNENMAQAARMHLQERNVDPRKTTMVAFGGAGPAHAAAIAQLLGIGRVVFPLGAGATSALGCLVAPLSFAFTRSSVAVLEEQDWQAVNAIYAEMTASGYDVLTEAGVAEAEVEFVREADLRVYGQLQELTIRLPAGELGSATTAGIKAAFADAYRQLYSRYDDNFLVEAVNWKLTCRAAGRSVQLSAPDAHESSALKNRREVYLPEEKGYSSVPVYDRYLLAVGQEVQGPAVIEEREATAILPVGSFATVDSFGDLVVDLAAGSCVRRVC